jgi:hypothetical protein
MTSSTRAGSMPMRWTSSQDVRLEIDGMQPHQ